MSAGRGWKVASVTALLVVAACGWVSAQQPAGAKPTPTLADARKFLEGRWALESFEVRPPGRPPILLKGEGVLTYDNFSNLRMEIRTDQATSDQLRAAGIDIREGILSTEGRTVIDQQNRTITYFLEGQPTAGGGPLATSRKRHYEVKGDVLTLTTRDDSGAPLSIGVWRRSK
jgi:hypothetical protein